MCSVTRNYRDAEGFAHPLPFLSPLRPRNSPWAPAPTVSKRGGLSLAFLPDNPLSIPSSEPPPCSRKVPRALQRGTRMECTRLSAQRKGIRGGDSPALGPNHVPLSQPACLSGVLFSARVKRDKGCISCLVYSQYSINLRCTASIITTTIISSRLVVGKGTGNRGSLESSWLGCEAQACWVGMSVRFCALSLRPHDPHSPRPPLQCSNSSLTWSLFQAPCCTQEKSWPQGEGSYPTLSSMRERPQCPYPGILALSCS